LIKLSIDDNKLGEVKMKSLIVTSIMMIGSLTVSAEVIQLDSDRRVNSALFMDEIRVEAFAQEHASSENHKPFDSVTELAIDICEGKLAQKKLGLDTYDIIETKMLNEWKDSMGNIISDKPLVEIVVECIGMPIDTVHLEVVEEEY
jgi:hypothetical protein